MHIVGDAEEEEEEGEEWMLRRLSFNADLCLSVSLYLSVSMSLSLSVALVALVALVVSVVSVNNNEQSPGQLGLPKLLIPGSS